MITREYLLDQWLNVKIDGNIFRKTVPWRSASATWLLRAIKRSRFCRDPRPFRRRSVLFLYHSYYHFYYLAQALRKRGWDAICVSYEAPQNSPFAMFYHGEDVNLYDADPVKFRSKIKQFFNDAKKRFSLLHFATDGHMSFFPENWNKDPAKLPADILQWRSLEKKVAYSISGCLSCVSQTSYGRWSGAESGVSACGKCKWQNRPEVCCDELNLGWGKKVSDLCNLIFAELSPPLDFLDSPKSVFDPVAMCLDPDFWKPDLEIPQRFRVQRNPGEYIVYHSVANHGLRTKDDGENVKGTKEILQAIDRLAQEGFKIRLLAPQNLHNRDVRYYQAQADVIVDQLYVGGYGATSREGMMLGKPTICYLNFSRVNGYDLPKALKEVPLVSATAKTIYEVLKNLLLCPDKRAEIGKKSREYALKWHGMDACAERYEAIYDQLMQNLSEV